MMVVASHFLLHISWQSINLVCFSQCQLLSGLGGYHLLPDLHDVSQITTCTSLPSANNYRWNVLQAGESLISLKEVFSGLQAA